MTKRDNSQRIDPDPFVIASLALITISVILSVVQAYKAIWPSPAPPMKPNHRPIQLNQLAKLEAHTESLQRIMQKISRTIERGASDSDSQFYDAPLRIGATSLLLEYHSLGEISEHYGVASLDVVGIFRWLNNIQRNNPDLAYRIGEKMESPLEGVLERMNEALSSGAPTRVAWAEMRTTLEALARAIESEMAATGN